MKIKCIKTSAAHWGIMFQEGKLYSIETFKENVTCKMITMKEEYFKSLLGVTSLTPQILQEERRGRKNSYKTTNSLYSEQGQYNFSCSKEMEKLIKLRNERLEYSNTFKFEVNIPFAYIRDEFNTLCRYCMLSEQQLQEKYNSSTFETSVNIFSEFFEKIDDIRERKINNIFS